jgi:hypothetical protein
MILASRELIVAGAIAGVAAVGLGLEQLGDPVEVGSAPSAARRHVERAAFCPPAIEDPEVRGTVAVAASSRAAIPIAFEEVRPDTEASPSPSPSPPASQEVDAGAFVAEDVPSGAALNAIGFGGHPVAGVSDATRSPVAGVGGARCSESPSSAWYFPFGSSELGFDERLLLYNPFPDEAVARISFFTPVGERSPGSLADVAVPSEGFEEVRVNEFVSTQKGLSASVEAARGRLIAWRLLFARPEGGTRGVSMTLGAAEPSPTWYFPDGFVGQGVDETFSVLNPSDDEATVNVSLIAEDRRIRVPEELFEIPVEPGTSQTVSLDEVAPASGSGSARVSAVVAASNGVDIVVERSLSLETLGYEGVSAEVGLVQPSLRWALPPTTGAPTTDGIAVLNPSNEAARVDVTLLTENGEKRPDVLTDVKIAPGLRSQIDLERWSQEEPVFAMLDSNIPVLAERLAYSASASDIADAMGRALTPSGP